MAKNKLNKLSFLQRKLPNYIFLAISWPFCKSPSIVQTTATAVPKLSRRYLTAVKREKFAKNKKTTSKERLSLLLFKVCYFTSILLIY